ncbi:MAG TPA: glycosyltransferase family 4 protein [Bryobacteraceae bacterium]|nr:glycosyltransferase family 4 protein [Bryobacteraceae bacterium]
MNILFLDQFATMGGGQRSLLEVLSTLREHGWNGRIAVPGEGPYPDALRTGGFPVDHVQCGAYSLARKRPADFARYVGDFPRLTQSIYTLTAKRRTGLLYVNGPRLLPAAAVVAKVRSIPLVFHSHHRIMQPVAVRLAGEALRWSNARMIACCRFAAEPLEGYLPGGRCRVVYNGIASAPWARSDFGSRKIRSIGVVGRIEPEKGQMEFTAAARIIAAEFADCRFIVAGGPLFSGPQYLEAVKKAARGLPFQFVGWQDNIGSVFSKLDLLVVPSTEIDSTPRVVIEAFSAGIPVVAFAVGGIPEIVEDGNTGFLAPERSAAALAARIRSVLRMHPAGLRDVVERARQAWKQRFTLERFQQDVAAVISEACLPTSTRNSTDATAATTADATSTDG